MSETIFSFSKKDLVSGKVYDPAWYRVRVDSVEAEPSKNLESPSTNYWVNATILFDADSGDKKYEDHPLRWNFNSKWMAPAKGYLMAVEGIKEEDITENSRFDLKATEGKELEVYVTNGLYEGRQNNKVDHKYRPCRKAE